MKVTYLKLENVAGLSVGSNKDVIEINFSSSLNRIVAIIGANGVGKTVLLSSITPFAYVTTLDDRSTLSYITPKKNGYKEIHYQDGDNYYIIKHYFKASKDTHTVKSYFMKNDEELNENGNVTSFNSLVELHFGLTQEMMRLVRIGTNVNSFISLAPARRKEYIGKLIEEIEMYLKIYKKINEDIRIVKTMLQANNTNLYNCHITDPVVEEERLSQLRKDIKKYERERDQIVAKISRISALINDNDIDDLRRKQQEAISSIRDFERVEASIKSASLEGVSVDELIKKRSKLSDHKIDVQSRINSFRISIDTILKNIERLELAIKKITSNNDVQSLMSAIDGIRDSLKATPKAVLDFKPIGSTSEEVHDMLSKLQSFNQISQMIITFGNKPIDVYVKLRNEGVSMDRWLKDQAKKSMSRINQTDLQSLFDQVFQNDMIITPNCDTEYAGCPYYRFSELITSIRDKMEEETFDDETLRYIQIITNNIDNIMNELDRMEKIHIPDRIRDEFTERRIIDRLNKKLPFFDLSDLQEYLGLLRDYEIYQQNSDKLKQYEYQLSVYHKAGVESQVEEIKRQRTQVESFNKEIETLQSKISMIQKELEEVDSNIALVTKFNDGKKYKKMFESTLQSTNKILAPLESAATEKMELDFSLKQISNLIASSRENQRELESKLAEYNRLVEEGKALSKKNKELNIILEAVSTKKGIPVFYMKRYLHKIQKLTNDLLQLIYDDSFMLAKFNVTPDTFEVPYIKNGRKIPDIKYASQSEIALATMALSFALANSAAGTYNILLLDEIDAGLDEVNRAAFLKMLYMQMQTLNAEQVFIISHNLSQMVNIPMDCIKMSETGTKSKLQNIIYE